MSISAQHKAALAQGRREGRAVRQYLEALGDRRRVRAVIPERLRDKIVSLESRIGEEANPLRALEMRQQRLDVEAALAQAEAVKDFSALEAAFVDHAKAYAGRKGISYTVWRESGVPAEVLRRAGITRTRT